MVHAKTFVTRFINKEGGDVLIRHQSITQAVKGITGKCNTTDRGETLYVKMNPH
jgi:hypothetical protein